MMDLQVTRGGAKVVRWVKVTYNNMGHRVMGKLVHALRRQGRQVGLRSRIMIKVILSRGNKIMRNGAKVVR